MAGPFTFTQTGDGFHFKQLFSVGLRGYTMSRLHNIFVFHDGHHVRMVAIG